VVTRAQHSSATPEHGTPHEIVELARTVLGGIDCDPCSSGYWNEHVVHAPWFWDAARPWKDGDPGGAVGLRWFINPPSGAVKEFWRFAVDRWEEGSSVFFVGFSLEQLVYLQRDGALSPSFVRTIPPARLKFLRRPGDVVDDLVARAARTRSRGRRAALQLRLDRFVADHPERDGAAVPGVAPTHGNYLLLLPSPFDGGRRRFERACAARGWTTF
jgi:hypothetical protein